jgi:hypothetical protein
LLEELAHRFHVTKSGQLAAADYENDWQDDEDYTYDLNGNRTTANGDNYTTGENNQLLSDDTYTYEYDAEGNRTKRYVSGTPNTDVTEYQWDHRNRLVQVTHYATEGGNADQIVQYAYDFGNRWVRRIIDPDGDATGENLQSTMFIYDAPAGSPLPLAGEGPGVRASQIVLQFDKEGSTSTPSNAGDTNLTHRYLWGTGVDQILADEQVHYDWTPEDYITDALLWPLGDHLGSVRDAVDNSGTVRIHRAYDAWRSRDSTLHAGTIGVWDGKWSVWRMQPV